MAGNVIELPRAAFREGSRKLKPMPLLDEGLLLSALDKHGVKRHNAYSMYRKIIQGGAKR